MQAVFAISSANMEIPSYIHAQKKKKEKKDSIETIV